MCAYQYGKAMKDSTGFVYNYESPSTGKKYLIQMNWDPELQKCAQSA